MYNQATSWTSRPEKGSPSVIKVMAWASLFFGRRATRPIIYLIALFYVLLAHTARRASRQYLALVLNRPPHVIDLFRHFLCFASVIHDRLFFLSDRCSEFKLSICGEHDIISVHNEGQGAVLYGAHFGSFDAVRLLANHKGGINVSLLMHEENGRKLMNILRNISPQFANSIIHLGSVNTMLEVQARLADGHMIGVLADRSVNNSEPGKPYIFLGKQANFPLSPFRLQTLLGRPAVFIAGIYLGGRNYKIIFRNLNPDNKNLNASALQSNYVKALEEICLEHPYNWFNFFDFWDNH